MAKNEKVEGRSLPDLPEKHGNADFMVYSKLLQKPFDTLEELKTAEDAYNKANEEKLRLTAEKKTRAKEVEEAYLEYQKVRKEAYKKISEAEKKWVELRDKFAKDYNGYHMTYVNNNGKECVTFSDLVDSFFTW